MVAERQDLVIRGVPIHNYRMAKVLDEPHARLTWRGGRISPSSCFRLERRATEARLEGPEASFRLDAVD